MQTATLSFVTDVAFATDMWEGEGWEAEVLCTMLLCLQVSLLAPPMYIWFPGYMWSLHCKHYSHMPLLQVARLVTYNRNVE